MVLRFEFRGHLRVRTQYRIYIDCDYAVDGTIKQNLDLRAVAVLQAVRPGGTPDSPSSGWGDWASFLFLPRTRWAR